MQPVALLCSEPLRPRMAGIGIRYFEMAKRLPALGVPVRLLSPFRTEGERQAIETELNDVAAVTYAAGSINQAIEGCRAVVAQGQLANEVIHQAPEMPLVVDLYDPWLVENLNYFETLGLDPYRNDHVTWMLQLSAGDLFLCSSDEQRLFYSGLLVAAGRVNPKLVGQDPGLDRLLRVVPFGVPAELPEATPILPERQADERRILFGGLYDWYDPWPLLDGFASAVASGNPRWRLFIVHNPNTGTPQVLVEQVRRWIRDAGLEHNVEFLDWIPSDRRYDLLRDVDVLAATHKDSLETRLSLRTRFLDALAAECPILVTEGGAMSRQLAEIDAGWVVPEGDAGAIEVALHEIFSDGERCQRKASAALELKREFSWESVLAPLVDYLLDPWRDLTKTEFARRPETHSPRDGVSFRIRRKLRRLAENFR